MLSRNQEQFCTVMGINPHQFIEMNAENMSDIMAQAEQEKREEQARMDEAEQEIMEIMGITPAKWEKMKQQDEACKVTYEEMLICQKMGISERDYRIEKMKAAGVKVDRHTGFTVNDKL